MQTPRGFLIGAGVIAAVAAFASVGHPRSQIAVETTAPAVTAAVEESTTTAPPVTDSDVSVLPERVEAGNTPTTTVELAASDGGDDGTATVNDVPLAPTTTIAPPVEDSPRRPSTSDAPERRCRCAARLTPDDDRERNDIDVQHDVVHVDHHIDVEHDNRSAVALSGDDPAPHRADGASCHAAADRDRHSGDSIPTLTIDVGGILAKRIP